MIESHGGGKRRGGVLLGLLVFFGFVCVALYIADSPLIPLFSASGDSQLGLKGLELEKNKKKNNDARRNVSEAAADSLTFVSRKELLEAHLVAETGEVKVENLGVSVGTEDAGEGQFTQRQLKSLRKVSQLRPDEFQMSPAAGSSHREEEEEEKGESSSSSSSSASRDHRRSAPRNDLPRKSSYLEGAKKFHQNFTMIREQKLWDELVTNFCPVSWAEPVNVMLQNWLETGITREQLDQFCVKKAARVTLIDGRLRQAHWRLPNMNAHRLISALWLIQMASMRAEARGDPLPPVEFVIQPGDGAFSTAPPNQQWDNAGPIFMNIKCAGDASVSFPMTFHDQFGGGHGEMSISRYEERYNELFDWGKGPWKSKVNQMFFSAGGGATSRGNRTKLYELKTSLANVQEKGFPLSEYGRYRYLVYAYGHCGWSRRIHELAFMRSVVFMEHSDCREYMHYLFTPHEHYVPVTEDFSDIEEKLEKYAHIEDRAEKMADDWFSVASASFSLSCTLDYIEQLLRKYATLQKFEPKEHPEWPLYTLDKDPRFFQLPEAHLPASSCIKPKPSNAKVFKRSHSC